MSVCCVGANVLFNAIYPQATVGPMGSHGTEQAPGAPGEWQCT